MTFDAKKLVAALPRPEKCWMLEGSMIAKCLELCIRLKLVFLGATVRDISFIQLSKSMDNMDILREFISHCNLATE